MSNILESIFHFLRLFKYIKIWTIKNAYLFVVLVIFLFKREREREEESRENKKKTRTKERPEFISSWATNFTLNRR